jgi:hypothetical protein
MAKLRCLQRTLAFRDEGSKHIWSDRIFVMPFVAGSPNFTVNGARPDSSLWFAQGFVSRFLSSASRSQGLVRKPMIPQHGSRLGGVLSDRNVGVLPTSPARAVGTGIDLTRSYSSDPRLLDALCRNHCDITVKHEFFHSQHNFKKTVSTLRNPSTLIRSWEFR